MKKEFDFAVFDIETTTKGKIIAIGLVYENNYYYFKNLNHFFKFIFYYNINNLYAHNGGRFDFIFLIDYLRYKTKIDYILQGGSVISFKFKYDKKTFRFKDSYALLKSSLSKLTGKKGKVNYKKLEDKIYWKTKGKKYLENDCRILYEMLSNFFVFCNENFKITPTLTIASTSLKAFRKGYTNKISLPSKLNEHFRKGFVGGHVDVYVKGLNEFKLFYYDVNQLYPFIMRENVFPCGNFYKKRVINPCSISSLPFKENYIFEGRIEIRKYEFLNLPIKFNKKVYFGYGQFQGLFFSPEINILRNYDVIKEIEIENIWCSPTDYIFKKYMTILVNNRIDCNKQNQLFFSECFKYMANSLFGKFSQSEFQETIVTQPDLKDIKKELKLYNVKNNLFTKEFVVKNDFKNVAISGFITSYARVFMSEIKLKLNSLGINVFYQDTDSLVVNEKLPKEFLDKFEAGKFKLEDVLVKSYFAFPKFYWYENEKRENIFKTKGIKITTKKQFFDYLAGEKLYHKNLIRPFKSSIKEKNMIKYNYKTPKKLGEIEDKRNYNKIGFSEQIFVEGYK